MKPKWKWYVYQFFAGDKCMYVGKGSGVRFKRQACRFSEFRGFIAAYFDKEEDALTHEKSLIIELAPPFNKTYAPTVPSPWLYKLLPSDKEFYAWCDAIGTRHIAARALIAKGRKAIEKAGCDYDRLLDFAKSKLAQNVRVCA